MEVQWKKGLPPCGDNPFRVGLARFELAASSSRTKRATKLRHSPMLLLRNKSYCTTFGRLWQFVGVLHVVDHAEDSVNGTVFQHFRGLSH